MKHTLNPSYFSNIDTDEKAYYLGLLASDGHISNGSIHLRLHWNDRELVAGFAMAIGSDVLPRLYIQTVKGTSCSGAILQINSVEMCKDLAGYGIVPAKTKTVTWPTLPKELELSFLRGYYDGNGGLSKKGTWSIAGNLAMCEGALDVLVRNGMRKVKIFVPNAASEESFKFEYYSRAELAMLYSLLYDSRGPCLFRKERLMLQLLQTKNPTQGKERQ